MKEKKALSLAPDHASFLRGYGEKNATTPAFCPLITLWFWLTIYLIQRQIYKLRLKLLSLVILYLFLFLFNDDDDGDDTIVEKVVIAAAEPSICARYIVSQNHNVTSGQNAGVVAFFFTIALQKRSMIRC